MSEMPRYAFDIETTGLDWRADRVTTYALYGENVSVVEEGADERRLVLRMRDLLASLPAGVVLTWNGAVFDGPFVAGRSKVLGLPEWFDFARDPSIVPKYEPQPGFEAAGLHPIFPALGGATHSHTDIAYGYWRSWAQDYRVQHSLKPVARAVGIEVVKVDREHMGTLSVSERLAYCLSDVVATYRLAELARVAARRNGSPEPAHVGRPDQS